MGVAVGDVVTMFVTRVAGYACWGVVGGETGFVHCHEWSWDRPIPDEDVPQLGDPLTVRVFRSVDQPQAELPDDVTFGGQVWVDFAGSVKRPQPEPPNDAAAGPAEYRRREIHARLIRSDRATRAEADAFHPLDQIPADPTAAWDYLSGRHTLIARLRRAGRRAVADWAGLDDAGLTDIEAEADREGWPPWDGLADEEGPIPAFGPVKLNKKGRPLTTAAEHEARRMAIRRMPSISEARPDDEDRAAEYDEMLSRLARS